MQKGMEKGMQEAAQKIACELLSRKMSPVLVAQVTKLSFDEVLELESTLHEYHSEL